MATIQPNQGAGSVAGGHQASPHGPRVGIVGAGASGLCMAIGLKEAGFHDFLILEKSDGVGGTWRDNTYPGAGCDVPSHMYSFSFAPNPDWSEIYSPQPEILAYFEDCARRWDLLPHCRFRTEIESAVFDEAQGNWRVRTKDGRSFAFDVLVSGVGQLNKPAYPDLPGLDGFRGQSFHSARWDHGVPLAGRSVAVIGNGASALQFIPHVAAEAGRLTVFQRSNNYVIPRNNRPYTEREKAWFRRAEWLRLLHRGLIFTLLEKNILAFRPGTLMARAMAWMARRHLEAQVADPVLRARLTPDYPVGCKRILIGDDYYPALQRDNVEVVTEPIDRVTPGGIVTRDGREFPVDVILYGTGFVTTDFVTPMAVVGRGGRTLQDAWKSGAEAYRGVAVPGFPNFFLLYGPNTNLGHNSILFMIEGQVRYVLRCLQQMQARRLRWIDVRTEAMERFQATLQKALGRMVWGSGCHSWYKTADGKVTNNWSGSTLRYRWGLRRPRLEDYECMPAAQPERNAR